MRPKIRPFNREDKTAVIRILRNTPEFTPAEVDVAEEVIDAYIQAPVRSGYKIFVAEVDSLITGYICYGPTPLTEGTWDIYWMAVARGQQGKGVGKSLLASAEDKMRETNGRLALIETSAKPEYEGTRRFHLSQGYELACRIADFYAPGDDKLVFQKRLR
jgi:GNAT superfamily N-acetyltransferase